MNRRAPRLATWIAIAGVAFGALWPLISHARPATERVPILICGPGGMQQIHVDQPVPATQDHREHCALCLGAIEPVAYASIPGVAIAPSRSLLIRWHASRDAPPAPPPPRPPSQGPPAAIVS